MLLFKIYKGYSNTKIFSLKVWALKKFRYKVYLYIRSPTRPHKFGICEKKNGNIPT